METLKKMKAYKLSLEIGGTKSECFQHSSGESRDIKNWKQAMKNFFFTVSVLFQGLVSVD